MHRGPSPWISGSLARRPVGGSPHRLTPPEVRAIKDVVTALEYRHVPTGTLAILAQRLGRCGPPAKAGE